MSGCFNADTLECCKHGVHVRLKCGTCESEHKYNLLQSQIELIQKQNSEMQLQIEKCIAFGSRAYHPRRPYKCPVCDGYGMRTNPLLSLHNDKVNIDFYSCEGKGIVWG